MTFNSQEFSTRPGTLLHENRYRSVELSTVFRQITCYGCDFTDIYEYSVKQLRRKSEQEVLKEGKLLPDEFEAWRSIPRYAEIPETLRCKKCGEILGLYTECIF